MIWLIYVYFTATTSLLLTVLIMQRPNFYKIMPLIRCHMMYGFMKIMYGLCSYCFDSCDEVDGPAEDLYGIFINRVRRERPPEFSEKIRG